ncbi:cysteine desulfurase family protein [Deinococcus cellulosilyticus]|uniref:cysteine desulfurase n=1 Tax=Deinococcus cellulosilyticus (strain DSM 18568 / NBRC 106333 / KACC 11606 / 5516J-15) TaxID=1223518 RepID=A0A511N8M1_DEIC1|nr:cysteine desulfurase family protein [Deinococcus cellulosilyticus]GEM49184.1 cysteine desulfurase IscS [Deinococcus cellulosilyticus NBRC 106333 = KACC 11606]
MTVYLDFSASTPCDQRVVERMLPFFTEQYANPSSTLHMAGRQAKKAVETAREQVAELLGAFASEIIFTSGASESNNLALLGVARKHTGKRRKILTTTIEHKAILNLAAPLAREGFELIPLPVTRTGRLDLEVLRANLSDEVLMVSVQAANNEIGTLQDIPAIAELAHESGAYMHTDATQYVGQLPLDVIDWDVDLLSLSGHKLYGPKGVGALFIRGGAAGIPIEPLIYGGGQEWNLRSGTTNVPGVVGLGKAAEITRLEGEEIRTHLANLRSHLLFQMHGLGLKINGDPAHSLPGVVNLMLPDLDSEVLIAHLANYALSNGSACRTGALEPSYVIQALGYTVQEAYRALRISLGRSTSFQEVEGFVETLKMEVLGRSALL